jgi:hypothetical protein
MKGLTMTTSTAICAYCADDYNQMQLVRLYGEEFSNYSEENADTSALCAICDLPCGRTRF